MPRLKTNHNLWGPTIQKATPAIVTIVISKNVKAVKEDLSAEMLSMIPNAAPREPIDIPPEAIDAHGMVKIGSGSGFVVDPSGIILTNKHVIADPTAEYTVITNDDRHFKAELLARDPIDDVAIIKISALKMPTLTLGDSTTVELGQPVLAIGNALGLFKNTVSSGIISGLSRAIAAAPDLPAGRRAPSTPLKEMRGLIQTDTAINPGNSGGPLMNLRGHVIGINAAIVFGAQNLSFSIPINAAKRDLADIKQFGRIKRPLLGLRYICIDDMIKEKMKLPVNYGALVMGHGPLAHGVIPGSPAAHAGIKEKDIILECNGVKIANGKTPQDFLEELSVGDIMKLKILRNGQEKEVSVVLAERK